MKEADSPVSAYASVDASSDSALAEASFSLVAADAESDYSYASSVGDFTRRLKQCTRRLT